MKIRPQLRIRKCKIPKKKAVKEYLDLTSQIADQLAKEVSMGILNPPGDLLIMIGARWQRRRIVEELQARLESEKDAIITLDQNMVEQREKGEKILVTLVTKIRAEHEGKIQLLESLLAKLKD